MYQPKMRFMSAGIVLSVFVTCTSLTVFGQEALTPLIDQRQPVDWWFVFKFNSASFPGCGGTPSAQRACPFGGDPQAYKLPFSQQFVFASSKDSSFQKGTGCVGDTIIDPLGATFGEVYDKPFFYVIWNDQLYDDPKIKGCQKFCAGPWGHSKGMLVWNEAGEGMVLQVTTPSWPASVSRAHPRMADGNTLGCVKDNNVMVSQHFFALKLSKDDVVMVLSALRNASIVTDPNNPELVNSGGPADIKDLVSKLGAQSNSTDFTKESLSSGVELISKPSHLNVPPWQFVSSVLGGVSLRTATWWSQSKIYTTTAGKQFNCWDARLQRPGRVEIATTGQWNGTEFGLMGSAHPDFNHAKIGVSISGSKHYSILGDMNQEGALNGDCTVHQNGRGGLFFVLQDEALFTGLTALLDGNTAPTRAPK